MSREDKYVTKYDLIPFLVWLHYSHLIVLCYVVQVLAAPNTVKTYKKFNAEVYVLTHNEGGRHTPFFNNYR